MKPTDIQVSVEQNIPKPVEEVFDAIINPDKMSNYFISSADSPMVEGKTVTWAFADVGVQLRVFVREVVRNQLISFEWPASGVNTQVDIELESPDPSSTHIRVTEAGWDMQKEGVARALEQSQGWTDFLCCMKAYLLFGINLRRGETVGEQKRDDHIQQNKDIALDFLRIALVDGQPVEAVQKYLSSNFKQHNPAVADGPQALADSIAKVVRENPSAIWEPKRAVGEGNLVVVHGHRRFNPADRGVAVVNIFRIVDGKIVEQWSVGQPVPETSANQNTMF